MLVWEPEELYFYKFAMDLFSETGHISTSEPVFINHSSERFVYFDMANPASLTADQRKSFQDFNNVSHLFTVQNCAFFAINLKVEKKSRSQVAHGIHTMIHPLVGEKATICLFKNDDEVMLSFVGYRLKCILSNWFRPADDMDMLADLLDIANMSTDSGRAYFFDYLYSFARDYYAPDREPTFYDILPIDIFMNGKDVDKEELDNFVREQQSASILNYGDDYVAYDESFIAAPDDMGADLDLMLLDIDEDDDDNPFGEEIEDTDAELDEDDEYHEGEEEEVDEYEFEDVDPEIFRDPTLMVKWIEKNS